MAIHVTPTKKNNESTTNNNENKSVERIYIGGLDPYKGLSASDLVERIRMIQDVTIRSIDVGEHQEDADRRTYLFVDAIPKKEKSALDIVSSHYHNVMWKGCKLRVEGAKLHFLERLKLERQGRLQEQQLQAEQKAQQLQQLADAATSDTKEEDINIPRHLRIKRKHGEEAFIIDTKPRT
eukprot:1413232-Ditylum_brightwellii.AAC.1